LWLGVGNDPTLIYHSPVSLQLVYMAFLVMPASFWWAIARGELFDLRFVVRRGLQYVFARHGLVVITPLVIALFAVEAVLHGNESFRQILVRHAWLYFGAAAALMVFRRRRAPWLEALDRRLFRERYDAVQLLREVVAQLRTSEDLETAAQYAATQIDAALHPEWVAVCRYLLTDAAVAVVAGDSANVTWPRPSRLIEELRVHARPLEISARSSSSILQRLAADEVDSLEHAGVRLVVPATVKGAGDLMFVLGAKRSGEPYSKEDKNLVHAVAESLGHLAATRAIAAAGDDTRDQPETAWDKRVWSLADAVVRGSHVDWTKESTEVVADERRQMLLELQALERLMQVHGAPVDSAASGSDASQRLRRWGSFQLREQIGAGRFGSVYRAWDPNLERDVAIKLLDVAGVDRAAYLREARHLARVRHANVVHVYGAAEFDEISGFWMELIEGRTLTQIFQERGSFAVEELAVVGSVLCRALAAVHRAGLIHQDVKAQNVMREPDGRLVLMDLGAGSGIGHDGRPQSGTPRYMAPELFEGGTASVRSDIYSLGVLLFLLATGEFPTTGRTYDEIAGQHRERRGRTLRALRPDFPAGFLDAVDRVLSADPLQRFASADEFSASILAEVS
jgi:serine/threonine-protein kinase